MNREIKFRAWDIYKKVFIPTDVWAICQTDHKAFGIMLKDWEDYKEGEYFYPDFQVLNQYTELKDKNGVDIYEGDVLKDKKGKLCVVYYTTFMNSTDYGDFYSGIGFEFGENMRPEECVVIGNIYENEDLL